ncbi:hypothetical protein GCM10009744_33050 [Kribbella alba]|uniref:Tyr recombinase domain-containing protein n=1 Tax=Kribbella alba TaxID=190197 RepID=A0ABN2FDC2_9ACTN
MQEPQARYRYLAGAPDLELPQLRHTRATELTNDGVSPRMIQKRLGHRKLQTTLVYADHADAELRARHRRRARATLPLSSQLTPPCARTPTVAVP